MPGLVTLSRRSVSLWTATLAQGPTSQVTRLGACAVGRMVASRDADRGRAADEPRSVLAGEVGVGISVPGEPRWTDAPPAEKRLWRWAVEQLDDRIVVLPQVLLTVPDRGRVKEAEIDLVLLDPQRGITVVEVKGGRMHYDGTGRWLQNGKGRRDPVQQVKRAGSTLKKLLEQHRHTINSIQIHWVVATPDCDLDAPGGGVLAREQLWDGRAAGDLADRYDRSTGALASDQRPLGPRTDGIVRLLRSREVVGQESVAAAIEQHEHSVRVFGESHRNVLHQITNNPHVLVTGAAGTGKTLLGIEAAVRYATLGERVLFTCWNVVLGRWLRRAVESRLREIGSPLADEVTDDPTGRIVVCDLGSSALAGPRAGQPSPSSSTRAAPSQR